MRNFFLSKWSKFEAIAYITRQCIWALPRHTVKHPHIRTHDFGGQADRVVIEWVLSDKSASKCS